MLARLGALDELGQGSPVGADLELDELDVDAGVAGLVQVAAAALPEVGVEVAALVGGRREADRDLQAAAAQVGGSSVAAVAHLVGEGDDPRAHLLGDAGLTRERLVHRVDGDVEGGGDVLHRHAAAPRLLNHAIPRNLVACPYHTV